MKVKETLKERREDAASLESFLTPLPEELKIRVLGFFNTRQLQEVALVNRTAYRLAGDVHLRRLQQLLSGSSLWRYLPAIAQDTPGEGLGLFSHYLVASVQHNPALRHTLLVNYTRFSEFLQSCTEACRIPLTDLGLNVTCLAQIQDLAQEVLQLIRFNDDPVPFATSENLSEVINLAPTQENQIAACQRYLALDSILSSLCTIMAVSRSQPNARLTLLISNPNLSRGLTGAGLLALGTARWIPDILRKLAAEGMRIRELPKKTADDTTKLVTIDGLLTRVNVEELLSIELGNSYFLQLNHLVLVPYLLMSPLLLLRLSQAKLIEVLNRINNHDIEAAIRDHPALYPAMTCQLLESWIDCYTYDKSQIIRIILTQAELLLKLRDDQIVYFAKYLTDPISGPGDFSRILESAAFTDRLKMDRASNRLLMRLALLQRKPSLSRDIARNDYAMSLLTIEQIEQFITNTSLTHPYIALNNNLMDRLSSAQLVRISTHYPEHYYRPTCNRLSRLTINDLIEFSQEYLYNGSRRSYKQDYEFLLQILPNELNRRAALPLSERPNSAQWRLIGCNHPKIGLFIVQNHLNKFTDTELGKLYNHYKKEPTISPIVLDELVRRLRAQEQLESILAREQRRLFQEQPAASRLTPEEHSNINTTNASAVPMSSSPQQTIPAENPFTSYLLLFLGLASLILIFTGLGSALGLPLAVSITNFLFAFTPLSATVTTCLVGTISLVSVWSYWIYTAPEYNYITMHKSFHDAGGTLIQDTPDWESIRHTTVQSTFFAPLSTKENDSATQKTDTHQTDDEREHESEFRLPPSGRSTPGN